MKFFPIAALCSLAAYSSAEAMELSVREIGVGLSVWPSSFDYELDSSVIADSGTDSFDTAVGLDLGARWSFAAPGGSFGWLVTTDLLTMGMPYDGNDGLSYFAGAVGGGAAYSFARNWAIAADASIGYGLATLELPASNSGGGFSGDGDGYFVNSRVTLIYNAGRRWSLHTGIGYVVSSYDLSDGDLNATIDQAGVSYFFGVSWRISDVPTLLE